MKIAEILRILREKTGSQNVARRLLTWGLNESWERLFLRLNDEISPEISGEILGAGERFKNGEPLEYILGEAEFLGERFFVGPGVLIPRDESEILVRKTLEIARNFATPQILEIGLGSGIISISLAKNLPGARILASEISLEAIFWARKNIEKFGVNVEIFHTNLMDEIPGEFDIIVSNPPYIAKNYPLDIWVKSEPEVALFGGQKGDEILKKIINLSKNRTKFLACEIGYDQKISLSSELKKCGFKAEFYKDLAGFDRGFVAKKIKFE